MFVVLTREACESICSQLERFGVYARVSSFIIRRPCSGNTGEKGRFEFRASPTSLANEKKVARVLPWVQGVANNFRPVVPGQDRCRRIKCTRADFNQVSSVEREITAGTWCYLVLRLNIQFRSRLHYFYVYWEEERDERGRERTK